MPFKRKARRGLGETGPSTSAEPARVQQSKPVVERFKSSQAAEKYALCTSKRKVLMEKGFVYNPDRTLGLLADIHQAIGRNQWEVFCAKKSEAYVHLVQEFYANYSPATPDCVYVRGQHIPFTSAVINNLYSIPEVEDHFLEFAAGMDEDQLNDILHTICEQGAEWARAGRGAMTVPRRFLKPASRIWFHFLKVGLMPSTHEHVVHKERAVLLYCIAEGRPINVGELIRQQIAVCAGRNSGQLWFPSLISQLCQSSGVCLDQLEVRAPPSASITPATMTRLLHDDLRDDKGLPGSSAAPASGRAEPDSTNPPPNLQASINQLEQRLSHMEIMQFESMQLMREFWKYERQRDLALQTHFRANSMRFQSFPEFPRQLCSSSSEESEPSVEEVPAARSPHEAVPPKPARPSPASRSGKGKTVVAEPSSRKLRLRSASKHF